MQKHSTNTKDRERKLKKTDPDEKKGTREQKANTFVYVMK